MNRYQRLVTRLHLTEEKKDAIKQFSKTAASLVITLAAALLIIYLLGLTYRWTFQKN